MVGIIGDRVKKIKRTKRIFKSVDLDYYHSVRNALSKALIGRLSFRTERSALRNLVIIRRGFEDHCGNGDAISHSVRNDNSELIPCRQRTKFSIQRFKYKNA